MVLEIRWIVNLGDIVWNFCNLTMGFKLGDQEFQLNGGDRNVVKTTSIKQMTKLLSKKGEVASLQLCSISLRDEPKGTHRDLFS